MPQESGVQGSDASASQPFPCRIITQPERVNRLVGFFKATLGPPACWLWGCEVSGQERVPEGAAIIVANHASALDTLLLGWALPRMGGFIAKADILDWPLIGPLAVRCGGFPAFRGRGDQTAYLTALAILAAGQSVVMHPEGSRSPDGRWGHQRIRSGAARLALATRAPIVPVALIGTHRILGKGRHWPGKGQVEAKFGTPIPAEVYWPPAGLPEPERITHVNACIDRALRQLLPADQQT